MYISTTNPLYINKIVPAQRARALVAALEPPEQTHRVEGVLARRAPLVRCLHVRRNDRVADRAFALSLERSLHVLTERQQSVHQVAVGKHDHPLDGQQPAAPLLLVHEHTASTHNQRWLQWISRRKGQRQCHWWRLFIHRDAGNDLRSLG